MYVMRARDSARGELGGGGGGGEALLPEAHAALLRRILTIRPSPAVVFRAQNVLRDLVLAGVQVSRPGKGRP